MTYFSVVLILSAVYAWLTRNQPGWPLLVVVKNWLFPFSLFFLGRRIISNDRQLWFLLLCVAVVSFGLALHGLRDGLTTGSLLTNRPTGLLTGQANLFAGFLAMHALLFLFASRTRELGRVERLFLMATALLMLATLLFTLSRGAWLAFAVTAAVVGFATNRALVVLLVAVFLVGYRWAPQEAVTRVDMTVTAVEQSDDSATRRIARRFRRAANHPVEVVSDALHGQPDLGNRAWDLSRATAPGNRDLQTRARDHGPDRHRNGRAWAPGLCGPVGGSGDGLRESCATRRTAQLSASRRTRPPGGNGLPLPARLQRHAIPRPHGHDLLLAAGWRVSRLHRPRASSACSR